MDGAGKVAGHVRAGRGSGFVDCEISRAGKAKGGAAEGEAIAAVRAKGWRNRHSNCVPGWKWRLPLGVAGPRDVPVAEALQGFHGWRTGIQDLHDVAGFHVVEEPRGVVWQQPNAAVGD